MGSCVCPCTMVVCDNVQPQSATIYLSCNQPLPNIALAQRTAQPQSHSALYTTHPRAQTIRLLRDELQRISLLFRRIHFYYA